MEGNLKDFTSWLGYKTDVFHVYKSCIKSKLNTAFVLKSGTSRLQSDLLARCVLILSWRKYCKMKGAKKMGLIVLGIISAHSKRISSGGLAAAY